MVIILWEFYPRVYYFISSGLTRGCLSFPTIIQGYKGFKIGTSVPKYCIPLIHNTSSYLLLTRSSEVTLLRVWISVITFTGSSVWTADGADHTQKKLWDGACSFRLKILWEFVLFDSVSMEKTSCLYYKICIWEFKKINSQIQILYYRHEGFSIKTYNFVRWNTPLTIDYIINKK